MRGEYGASFTRCQPVSELPPHARRIHAAFESWFEPEGTTSACAENTSCFGHDTISVSNYLRMRGEYLTHALLRVLQLELPPHARRIQPGSPHRYSHGGTTSACAENTGCGFETFGYAGNYLRMRGEYASQDSTAAIAAELPPHARRIHKPSRRLADFEGTTSACAENTFFHAP